MGPLLEGEGPLRIRAARADDALAVTELWTEAYVSVPGGRDQPYTRRDFAASAGSGEIFVAEAGDRLAGVVVMLRPGSPASRVAVSGEAEISRLAVASRLRRRGVGRGLMSRCRDEAVESGCVAVVLWSRPVQREAHLLYEELGFERVPARDVQEGGAEVRLVFRLALTGSTPPGQR